MLLKSHKGVRCQTAMRLLRPLAEPLIRALQPGDNLVIFATKPVQTGGPSAVDERRRVGMADSMGDDERFIPSVENDDYFAFLSLYAAVQDLVSGKVVLDAGCGAGFGSFYLATKGARSVVAMDASSDGVKYGMTHYKHPSLTFVLGDCTRMPFWSQGFDVVFSSNVIEHVGDYRGLLLEVRRVMNRHGVFMFITPPVYRGVPVANPFHVTNFTARQWEPILREYFAHVEFFKHYTPNRSITFARLLSPEQHHVLSSQYFSTLPPQFQDFLRRKIFHPLNVDLGDWEIIRCTTLQELEEPLTCSVVVLCSDDSKALAEFSGTSAERLQQWRVDSLRSRLTETEAVLYQLLTRNAPVEPKQGKIAKIWRYSRKGDARGLWREVENYVHWRLRR